MRLLLPLLLYCSSAIAQNPDWIAPEGKVIDNRTLTWDDFQSKEDKAHATELAERNLQAAAYVCPAIYYYTNNGLLNIKGRLNFIFTTKCAFQSRAFVRESIKAERSNYVLIHEQDHYDIALTYARKLQETLSSRDYDKDKYEEELHAIYTGLMDKHHATQQLYDAEVNPNGTDDTVKQALWDMRIKKCMENNTLEYFTSPPTVVQTAKYIGPTVKRQENELDLQFVVRCRPLYQEFSADMAGSVLTTTEWSRTPSILAFYTHRTFEADGQPNSPVQYRTIGYIFIPNGTGTYRRTTIDTFYNEGFPVKIAATFFANADSDANNELVIVATSQQKGPSGTGTMYINRVYDDVNNRWPPKLKRVELATAKIAGGLEGTKDGKMVKAKYKTQQEIIEALKR
jgi:hypothetical protein